MTMMTTFARALTWLHDTPMADAIRESSFVFPLIESTHVLAITTVVGTISVVDLRLLGFTSKNRAISTLTKEVLPITWTAFVIAATTGFLLFSSNAINYAANPFFRAKMLLLLVAFCNVLAFHFILERNLEHWDEAPRAPPLARLSGGLSLALWISVIVCGRWIGFTMNHFGP
jgi:hypothetical protein